MRWHSYQPSDESSWCNEGQDISWHLFCHQCNNFSWFLFHIVTRVLWNRLNSHYKRKAEVMGTTLVNPTTGNCSGKCFENYIMVIMGAVSMKYVISRHRPWLNLKEVIFHAESQNIKKTLGMSHHVATTLQNFLNVGIIQLCVTQCHRHVSKKLIIQPPTFLQPWILQTQRTKQNEENLNWMCIK